MNLEAAEVARRRALTIREAELGSVHPLTAESRGLLAEILEASTP